MIIRIANRLHHPNRPYTMQFPACTSMAAVIYYRIPHPRKAVLSSLSHRVLIRFVGRVLHEAVFKRADPIIHITLDLRLSVPLNNLRRISCLKSRYTEMLPGLYLEVVRLRIPLLPTLGTATHLFNASVVAAAIIDIRSMVKD